MLSNNIISEQLMSYLVGFITIVVLVTVELYRSRVTKTDVTDKLLKGAFIALTKCRKPIRIEVPLAIIADLKQHLREKSLTQLHARKFIDIFKDIAEANHGQKSIQSFFSNLISVVFTISDDVADIELINNNAHLIERVLDIFTKGVTLE